MQFEDIPSAPIAWCQSTDGLSVFLLANAKDLRVLSVKSNEVQLVRFGDDCKTADRPALWCSPNGDRFIARDDKFLKAFAFEDATGNFKPSESIECPYDETLVAFGREFILVCDRQNTKIATVARTKKGQRLISELGTGLVTRLQRPELCPDLNSGESIELPVN